MDKVIKKIFGVNAMNELMKKVKTNSLDEEDEDAGYDDYMTLLDQIEEFKIGIDQNFINDTKRINCTIFKNFVNEDISELIEKYNNSCPKNWKIAKYSGFKIHFPYEIMIDLTKEVIVDNTVNYIFEIIDHVKNINSIIYAGSVSKNHYIISLIQKQLPSNINHCVTPHPVLAVARGAVMFGMNPMMIKSRIARFNIGIKITENWNNIKNGKRKDLKFFCNIEKCYKCKNIFSPIIEKNTKIYTDDSIQKNYSILAPKAIITFLKADYNNVIFTDDNKKTCEKFGEIEFDEGKDYDENDKELIVELKLGGTFVDAKIRYKDVEKSLPVFFK